MCVYVSVCVYLYVQIRCRMTCVLARKRARAHIEGNSQTFNSASVFETEKKDDTSFLDPQLAHCGVAHLTRMFPI